MTISIHKTFHLLGTILIVFIGLYFGKPVLSIGLSALLLSFMIYPLASKIESWGVGRITAAILAMGGLFTLINGCIYLFSNQILNLLGDFDQFQLKLSMLLQNVVDFFNHKIEIIPTFKQQEIVDAGQALMKDSGLNMMSVTVNNLFGVFSGGVMIFVCCFLLLIYRGGLRKILVLMAEEGNRKQMSAMIGEIQQVGQQYLLGMGIVVVILGVANSVILLLFGLEHAILFGLLAAVLAIIPYVGTALGAAIPVLFAFFTKDSIWIPLGIAGCFWCVQLAESNVLSPKIVGAQLKINALTAIVTLFIGGYLWGVAGMILFLPLTAIFRVMCNYIEPLKPIGLLMSDDLYQIRRK
ncbi:AI-2E family transporter [Persicobacter psychrovividus]|uniref:AI-2E family transporter n=1 Tax=Persicobacter psychrovividus TaxID=387638 RepID=A0ABM7VIJ1_9BACT|nr:AI-2E family transporter [Persicobacter psychrovividus]